MEVIEKTQNHYVDNKELFKALVAWQTDLRKAAKKNLPKPQLPDYVAECMMKMANRLSQKAGFVNYCVDETTQALTKRGWLRHDQITTDDIILSCDPADNILKWGPIHEIFRNPHYSGMMFHLTGNGLDALVTPGHKFLTPERGLVKVEQLRQLDHITLMGLPVASPEHATYSDAFVQPKTTIITTKTSTPYTGIVWCPVTDYGTFVCCRTSQIYTTGNSYRDEMVADSMESCLRYIHNFNPAKSTNAFAYITQIIHNAFIRRIQKEQKQLYVKMRIVDETDFVNSYERQEGDTNSYSNSYVTYLQENKGDVIQKFENWKESKKNKAAAKKKEAKLTAAFEEEIVV